MIMVTPLVATTPLCTEAEADVYFDPANNHLYAEEWWAADLGAKATLMTDFATADSNMIFEAVDYGVDGNLICIEFDDDYGPPVMVEGKYVHCYIDLGVTTLADLLASLTGEADFNAIATVTAVGGTDGLVSEYSPHFLWGGVDPDTATTGRKLPALAFATRKINNLPFNGMKVSPTQANAFPRMFTKRDGSVYTQTEVPLVVRYACCEEALAIMKYGNTTRYKLQAQGVSSYGFGNQGLRESFVGSKEGDLLSGECLNLLRPFMRRNWVIGR